MQGKPDHHQLQKRPSHWSPLIDWKSIKLSLLRTHFRRTATSKAVPFTRRRVLTRVWRLIIHDQRLFPRGRNWWNKIQVSDSHAPTKSTWSRRPSIWATFDRLYYPWYWEQAWSSVDQERSIWSYLHKLNQVIQKFKPKNIGKWSHQVQDAEW